MRAAALALGLALLAGCSGARSSFRWALPPKPTELPTAADVSTLNEATYARRSARLLVRQVDRPTLAALDYAAYQANVMIQQPAPEEPPRPGTARMPAAAELFGGVLEVASITASLSQTGLSVEEQRRPLAFAPLVSYLARWDAEQAAGLEQAREAVRSESWGLPRRPGIFFQQISALYLHQAPGGWQAWVKIEFEPWAALFAELPDEDGDGYPELYGRLRDALLPPAVAARIVEDYQGRLLSSAEVHAWANELASYWYPSYNTDVVRPPPGQPWPSPEVEPAVVAAAGGLVVPQPTVIIRGKPAGEPIYNVFVVPGIAPLTEAAVKSSSASARPRGTVSPIPQPLIAALEAELQAHGDSHAAWAKQLASLHEALRAQLRKRPEALKALPGKDGFLFYRRSLQYIVGGDLQAQPAGKNPLPAIVAFKDYLAARGIDFLLVPVPTKAEVFPDKLRGISLPAGPPLLIHPYGRKLLLELARAGVEVVDLLPDYLAARAVAKRGQEPLYQPQDTHWTTRGLQLAAERLAERVQRYPWWEALAAQPVSYRSRPATFTREGDLVSRLAEAEQRRYRPARLRARQVLTSAGELCEDDPQSSVVVLGDSFTGVYQRTDCGAAGVSAQLALALRHPVDLVMSYGGGPNVRQKLLRRGEEGLGRARLIIWLFAARDFHDYWEDWEPLDGNAGKTGRKR